MEPTLEIDPLKLVIGLAETRELTTLLRPLQYLHEVGQEYLEALDSETLTEDMMDRCCWASKDARNAVLSLMDYKAAMGEDVSDLQDMLDELNGYVVDHLKMEMEQEDAQKAAMMTYQDEGMAMASEAGELHQVDEAAPLNAAMRRRHATVVRTNKDGTKEYKFPIPDKAHARAALARLNQSDLSAEEKAKVKRRAYRVLGQSPSKKTKEAHHMDEDHEGSISEAIDATIGGVDELNLLTLTEAKLDLKSGELTAVFLQPGLNRSGARYYPKSAIKEAVDAGMFNGLKMYLNHGTPQELASRPERSLTDWVSTIKETWVDPSTGAGMAKIKVVQGWFKNFLKDLQEAGALPEIGLSIFAQGKVKPEKRDGKMTHVVEKFKSAMSVDWVTEPGAGGRVTAIWESYQPMIAKEQEINMLNSMKVDEALKEIRESRPDVFSAIVAEVQTSQQTEEEKAKAAADFKALQDQVATLTESLAAKEKETAEQTAARIKAEQTVLVTESLSQVELPQLAKGRIMDHLMRTVHEKDGALDTDKVKESITSVVKEEQEYVAELLKGQPKPSTGIKGMGDSAETTNVTEASTAPTTPQAKFQAGLDKRLGLAPVKTAS